MSAPGRTRKALAKLRQRDSGQHPVFPPERKRRRRAGEGPVFGALRRLVIPR